MAAQKKTALRGAAKSDPPPADWTPTQAVESPVINSPFDEPKEHWVYPKTPGGSGAGAPYRMAGRRPASYWYKTQRTAATQQALFAEEERDELPLVNRLRNDVRRWREVGYRGASPVSKELFAWWSRPDRPRPLFFCQLEAAETVIYLLEIAFPGRLSSTGFKSLEVDAPNLAALVRGERPPFQPEGEFFPRLVDPAADRSLLPLRRLGCKMATGSGKTVVMAMLIIWAFANRGRNPATATFPSGVLVCAPNLTVRNRLAVLRPDHSQNYYDDFDLVPPKFRDLVGAGRVLVTNWHAFAPKSAHSEGGTSYRVVDKGEETPEAFAKDRLGELAARLPILVLNDEGHHCWRPAADTAALKAAERGITAEEKKALEEEVEEARVWLAGLDRINNCGLLGSESGGPGARLRPGILACVDLSATPFYLGGSGHVEGSPFPWLVSDFGLIDAIESGIVKIPRLPVRDDTGSKDDAGRPDPKYFRLWRHIDEGMGPADRLPNGRPRPSAVYREAEGALQTLAAQWRNRLDDLRAATFGEHGVPPVLIVVCDNTELSEHVFERISGERTEETAAEDGNGAVRKTVFSSGAALMPELANDEDVRRTIRIDTKLLAKVETEEGETKDAAAEALRQVINTVGRRGGPGEQVRCVVSVSMLTEGWDATNVTHILGLRAFTSQLLCEQVVGRGLRRMSYTPDPQTGRLAPEYVDVYGIPFSLIPFKGKPRNDRTPDPVHHRIYAVPERAKLELRMPNVESYTYEIRDGGRVRCDVDRIEGLTVNDEPTEVFLTPTRGYIDDASALPAGDFVRQTRDDYYARVRYQQVVFGLAQLIVSDLVQGFRQHKAEGVQKTHLARHQLFPEVVRIVEEYVAKRVTFAKRPDGSPVDRREIGLDTYAQRLRERLRAEILRATAEPGGAGAGARLLPVVNSFARFASTAEVNYSTTRPVVRLSKSHLNLGAIRSEWEREAIETLEALDFVEAFAPNDRQVGFVVPYEHGGTPCRYEPDFVVRLRGSTLVLVEIKGKAGEIHDEDRVNAKNAAARRWVAAVNESGRYGRWAFEICRDLAKIREALAKHVSPEAAPRPFRYVTPRPEDRWKTCVPLTTLRVAAGRFSEGQSGFDRDLSWATDWVAYETSTRFEEGMFVARVQGESMSPLVRDGDYCLFRRPRAGSRQNRKLLVWHEGIEDPETGGCFTLKVYKSEKVAAEEGGWAHAKITLQPLNSTFPPIVLTPKDEGDVGVVAELVEVLR